MRKWLFSNVLALLFIGASCGGEKPAAEDASGSTQVEQEATTEEMPAAESKGATATPVSATKVGEGAPDQNTGGELKTEENTVHEHKAPEQNKIDSIKASYPEKKR